MASQMGHRRANTFVQGVIILSKVYLAAIVDIPGRPENSAVSGPFNSKARFSDPNGCPALTPAISGPMVWITENLIQNPSRTLCETDAV